MQINLAHIRFVFGYCVWIQKYDNKIMHINYTKQYPILIRQGPCPPGQVFKDNDMIDFKYSPRCVKEDISNEVGCLFLQFDFDFVT